MARNTVFRAIVGSIIGETAKAIRLRLMAEGTKFNNTFEWFPLSQISSIHRSGSAEPDVIMVSEWLLGQKGMLDISKEKNPALVPDSKYEDDIPF